MRRVLIYAAIYGGIGAMVGAMIALYTREIPLTSVVLKNGSATKASKHVSSTPEPASSEVAEPSHIEES